MASLRIKLVVFDLDGTMIDSCPDLASAANKAMLEMGRTGVTVEQVAGYIGNGADVLVSRALSQSVEVDPALDPETKSQARVLFDKHYHEGGHILTTLYPGVKETLSILKEKGVILAVLTNKPSAFVPGILEEQGIASYFVDVLGGDTFEAKKPDPVGLKWLMKKHGVLTYETVMIGDSKNDILAAKSAGTHSIGVTYGYNYGIHISESSPDCVFDSFSPIAGLCEDGIVSLKLSPDAGYALHLSAE